MSPMLRQGGWLSRTDQEDAAEAKEPHNKQVAASFRYNYCFWLFIPGDKRFVFLFSESSPAKPHPRQANSTSKGEVFYAQTVHCARTSDLNTVEQRNYLKLSHFDAFSLFTGAGTEELRRRERGERTWKSSTLWAKPVLMCQQDTLTAHLQHVHTLLLTHDRL